MGGMLENMIRGVMERKIGEEYPQAQLPPRHAGTGQCRF